MPIRGPDLRESRSRKADWFEVQSLASPRETAPRELVHDISDFLEDESGDEDEGNFSEREGAADILGSEREERADEVLEELAHREKVLGSYYPFKINHDDHGQSWTLKLRPDNGSKGKERRARLYYTFCLLVSAMRDGTIELDSFPDLKKEVPKLFENIACKAAEGVIGGEAYNFGWPREDKSSFRDALKELCQKLGMGKITHETHPKWSSGKEKDVGIDVVAWRDFPDKWPGKLILYGQTASGCHWEDKGVNPERLHDWFSEPPTKHYMPAIFTPFPQYHSCNVKKNGDFEEAARAHAWRRGKELGLVIDRLRIVHEAAKGPAFVRQRRAALENWVKNACKIAGE